MKNCCS